MNSPRLRIITLMCVVGMVAISLAVSRALYAADPRLLPGVCLAGLAIQVGLFRIVRTRGRSRAFRAGFVVCGLLAAGSFAWGKIVRNSVEASFNATTGELTLFPRTALEKIGSTSYTIWRGYIGVAFKCLRRLPFGRSFVGRDILDDPVLLATAALIAGLPQLLIALAGGLLARQFFPRPHAVTS